MHNASEYRTKQKSELIGFLESVKGEHLTAKAVCDGLAARGVSMGQATVYRHLERFVSEGLVRKYALGATGASCFEYVGESGGCAHDQCFHCICTQCGKLIHLQCNHLSDIAEHIQHDHRFTVDPLRTVFYGICEDCARQQ